MENNDIKVTVCCITYNHAKYIREALEGFVTQKTTFPFIVLVGDDCSTDGTREIIKEYAEKYPDIIKPVFREKNIGGYENLCGILNMTESEYVALCEGDDYWTDKYKLQKQVNILDKNKDCTICFNRALFKFENGLKKDYVFPRRKLFRFRKRFTFQDLLKRNFIQTNACMYRYQFRGADIRKIYKGKIMPGDWFKHLLHAQKGDILLLDEVMSVYRINPDGVWYDSFKNPEALILKHGLERLRFYKEVVNTFNLDFDSYIQNFKSDIADIISVYCKNFCTDEMNTIKNEFPEFVKIYQEHCSVQKTYKKLKKYKTATYILTFILFLLLFLLLLY